MTSVSEERQAAVERLIDEAQSILGDGPPDRDALGKIKSQLEELASKTRYWEHSDYPDPDATENQNRFWIGGADEGGITLYLNVMRPGKKIPPHDHTTWACISAVVGVEHNTLYNRLDDGSVPGSSDVQSREVVALCPGTSIAMMPDDIHSVEIRGDEVIRHLHFYGRPLETLNNRKMFDLDAGTYRVMDIGVKTKG